ncbi:MAG: hypothetical protein FJ276_24755 [Planctomycetes bacterium]|nr:hypothetical protein [Planctomycetota bacterium]
MSGNLSRRNMVMAAYIAVLLAVGACDVVAQTHRVNPLRAAPQPPASEPSVVQQASANLPIAAGQQVVDHRPAELRRESVLAPARNQPPRQMPTYGMPPRPIGGFVPRHQVVSGTMTMGEPTLAEPIPMGELDGMFVEEMPGVEPVLGADCLDDGGSCGGCGACGSCVSGGCVTPFLFLLNNAEFFAGTQGYTGPANRGETGSFGFHYGANWGAPVPCLPCSMLGMQIGYRGTSSNYSGASSTPDTRNQSFLTAGLFRRVDWGLQGGVVFDFMRDHWYHDLSVTQLRGELSWVFPQCHELGFWFASGTRSNTVETSLAVNGQTTTVVEEFEPTDLYAFFYRRRFECLGGGYGRFFAGFSGASEGLIGGDFKLPLTPNWAVQTGFTYLIPKDGNHQVAYAEEAWNLGVTLVWYPGCRKAVGNDYYRPLFDVADNGTFITRLP